MSDQRFNTGNPIGSSSPLDRSDNTRNLDVAVNSDGDTFQDRLGKSRLTWAGIVKAGSGDPAIAVDAAARAETAASQVQQDADRIAADAAQQAVQDVVNAVDGQVAVAQGAADRAEIAAGSVKPYVDGALSDLSTAANKFYPTLAAANADISNITVNQPVTVGDAVNGGLWYKATSEATTLTKSAYDPLTQAHTYTDVKVRGVLTNSVTVSTPANFNLLGYYYWGFASPGSFQPSSAVVSTDKVAVYKGEKVYYGVKSSDSTATGRSTALNMYSRTGAFLYPAARHRVPWVTEFLEGVFEVEEDGYVAASSYVEASISEEPYLIVETKSDIANNANNEDNFTGSIGGTCVISPNSTVIMSGASFAYSSNGWFELMCSSLGVTGINKSSSGHGIGHLASRLYNNTFYIQETLNSTDALIIMHVWNYDVNARKDITINGTSYTDDQLELWTASDYEATEWSWLTTPPANSVWDDATMSAMWDYVFKKLQAIYYAEKDNAESKWHGTTHGKPFNVILTTHWHDARAAFNTSVRELAAKWGCTLIKFDDNIGFSKDKPHVSGVQHSRLYERDGNNPEVIDGVTYGWHYHGGQDEPIVRKMAGIAKSVFEVI